MILHQYFCNPSMKLGCNPEQNSATEIDFQRAPNIPPPFKLQLHIISFDTQCPSTLLEGGQSFRQLRALYAARERRWLTSCSSPEHQESPHHGGRQLHKRKASVLLSLLVFDETNIIDCQRCIWRQGSHDGFHYCVRSNVSKNDG